VFGAVAFPRSLNPTVPTRQCRSISVLICRRDPKVQFTIEAVAAEAKVKLCAENAPLLKLVCLKSDDFLVMDC
jgi:hypothetical protein